MSKRGRELKKMAGEARKDPKLQDVAEGWQRLAEIVDENPRIGEQLEDDVRMFLTLLKLDFAGLYPHNLYDRDQIETLRANFDAEGLGSSLDKEYKRLEEGDRRLREAVREDVFHKQSIEYAIHTANGDFWNQEDHSDQRPDAWWYHPLKHRVVTPEEIAEKYDVDVSIAEDLAKAKMRIFDVYTIGAKNGSVDCLVNDKDGFFNEMTTFPASEFANPNMTCLYRCLEIKYENGRIERKFERGLRNLYPEEVASIRSYLTQKLTE